MAEYLDVYDECGNRIGKAPRSECHGNPKLLHHTSHVVVIHPQQGTMLLQKRSRDKDIQPGKWDTAVGGHLDCGEDFETGARRELSEELGVSGEVELETIFDGRIRNEIESEDTRVFGTRLAGPFAFQRAEIDEVRFFSRQELEAPAWQKEFTPNLVRELDELKKFPQWYPAK